MTRLLVAPLLAALLCSTGCSKPTPYQELKKDFGSEYEEFRRVLAEDGPAFAAGHATKLAGMLRDPAVTDSPMYEDPEFAEMNERTIELLETLEGHVQARFFGDIAITLDQLKNQCARCHKQFWKR